MLGDEAKAARLCTATVQSMELSQPSTEKVTQPGGESNTTDLNESENTTFRPGLLSGGPRSGHVAQNQNVPRWQKSLVIGMVKYGAKKMPKR